MAAERAWIRAYKEPLIVEGRPQLAAHHRRRTKWMISLVIVFPNKVCFEMQLRLKSLLLLDDFCSS